MLRVLDLLLCVATVAAVYLAGHLFLTGEDPYTGTMENVREVVSRVANNLRERSGSGQESAKDSGTNSEAGTSKNSDPNQEKADGADPASSGRNRWRRIVIHHSGTDGGSVEGFDRYHREELEIPGGVKYHFVIGNGNGMTNGRVRETIRWKRRKPGPQTGKKNIDRRAIGICLVGNFNKNRPNRSQLVSLVQLLRRLCHHFGIPSEKVKGANEWRPGYTDSPGRHFPTKEIREKLRRYLKAKR